MYYAPMRNATPHPDFPALICISCEANRLKPGNVAELYVTYRGFIAKPQDDGKFLGFAADSPFAGIDSYLYPSTTYRRTFSTSGRPTSLSGVGKINSDVPISVDNGATWLFTSKTWSRQGGLYSITEEYLLSGPKGWDTTIYDS